MASISLLSIEVHLLPFSLLVSEALEEDGKHLVLVDGAIAVLVEVGEDAVVVVHIQILDLSEIVLGSLVEGAELFLLQHAVVVGVETGPNCVNLLLSFSFIFFG